MAVRIVSDTTGYLPAEIVARAGIELVSLSVHWDSREQREIEMTDFDSFYANLHDAKTLPTTSQPSIGEFLTIYRPILEAGDEIVSVHLASALSGTAEAARQAKEHLEREGVDGRRIVVIDSACACGGLGLITLAGAQAASSGATQDQVIAAVESMKANLKMWFAVDTLEYLRRGGRIGGAAAWFGTTIKIKPILTVGADGITPVERVRTRARAMDHLIQLGEAHFQPGGCVIVQHIQAPELADQVMQRCRAAFGCEPVAFGEIGPVIGSHVGPGLIGLAIGPANLVDLT